MAATDRVVESAVGQVTQLRAAYSEELTGIVANARWIATLVLAEIGGLAGYRELQEAHSLSIPVLIAIMGLAVALLGLGWLAVTARSSQRALQCVAQDKVSAIHKVRDDGGVAPDAGDKQIRGLVETSMADLGGLVSFPRDWETVCMLWFGALSAVAAVGLFVAEVAALFR